MATYYAPPNKPFYSSSIIILSQIQRLQQEKKLQSYQFENIDGNKNQTDNKTNNSNMLQFDNGPEGIFSNVNQSCQTEGM